MPRRWPPLLAATAVSLPRCSPSPASASARWFGSTLQAEPNATYGCESALVARPSAGWRSSRRGSSPARTVTAAISSRTGPTFIAPSSGRITHIRVKAGPNPAKLRLTVLTGSSRVDTFTGRDLPGTYTCCTARYIGRAFRPRANASPKKKVDVRVYDVRSKRIQYRIHSSDGLALTAVGPGTLPLNIGPSLGGYDNGNPDRDHHTSPFTRMGEPRVEGYSMTGIDLLFQWNFRRR